MWGRFRYHYSNAEWNERKTCNALKKYMQTPLYKIAIKYNNDFYPIVPKFVHGNKFIGYMMGTTLYDWYISPSFKKEQSANNRVNKIKEYYEAHKNRKFWNPAGEFVLVYLNQSSIPESLKALNIKIIHDFTFQNGKFVKAN